MSTPFPAASGANKRAGSVWITWGALACWCVAQTAAPVCCCTSIGYTISPRVLRDHSKMREVGQRTERFRVGFQLVESFTYLVNHVIKRGKSQIGQLFFAQFFPHVFHEDSRSGL